MRPSSIKYYFKEGFTSLIKNRLMSIASIATVAVCILITTFSYCVISNLNYILEQMEDQIGIAVFVEDNLNADDVSQINDKIKDIEHVVQVTYITPEEALEKLKVDWDMEGILDGFDKDSNPLSSSFEVSLDNIENQNYVLTELEKIDGVRNIRHAQTETDILIKLNKGVTIVGSVIIGILLIISIVIIMNSIKISVYTRRTEIGIMKYVGATDWFIRWPFVIEGVLIGIIGASIPLLISWLTYGNTKDLIYRYLPVLNNIVEFRQSIEVFTVITPVALCAGILMGVVGSTSSIKKYLRV